MNPFETEKYFVYMWAYPIKAETTSDFERIYGPNGDWVQLFKKGEGYLGTELRRDVSNGLRYVTLDLANGHPFNLTKMSLQICH